MVGCVCGRGAEFLVPRGLQGLGSAPHMRGRVCLWAWGGVSRASGPAGLG